MGFKHRHYLAGSKVYSCSVCRTHMATIESMISRRFNGQHGQAYLFETVFNIAEGEAEDRQMTTGLHRVRDIRCAKCGQTMGWKYERAYEQSQKYKEGKSILEKALLVESTPANSLHNGAGASSTLNGSVAAANSSTSSSLSPSSTDGSGQYVAQLVNIESLSPPSRISLDEGSYSVRSLSTVSADDSE